MLLRLSWENNIIVIVRNHRSVDRVWKEPIEDKDQGLQVMLDISKTHEARAAMVDSHNGGVSKRPA